MNGGTTGADDGADDGADCCAVADGGAFGADAAGGATGDVFAGGAVGFATGTSRKGRTPPSSPENTGTVWTAGGGTHAACADPANPNTTPKKVSAPTVMGRE